MNNRFIYFGNEPILINGFIKCAVTPTVVDQLKRKYNAENVFLQISSLQSLLISAFEKKGKITYKLHTSYGVFTFVKHDTSDVFLLVRFDENNFLDTNESLMYGIRFFGTKGTVILVRIPSQEWYAAYADGRKYEINSWEHVSGVEALNVIVNYCQQHNNANKSVETKDSEEMNPALVKLLNLAESYSILSNDLENKIAEELGQVPYISYDAIDYPRHDRIAYEFCLEKQEAQLFTPGTNIDIMDSFGNISFTAEVVDVKNKKDKEFLTVLFTKEVDVSNLPQMGWLSLPVSTVNMDVQLGAIKKLREGTAKANYFNDVFGKKSPKGFDENDLRSLENQLAQRKYPPNKSQIDAIKNGINTKDVFLVMGPPGTGKTTVILEWVKYFVKEKHLRVLVSSQNNKAVDNVLERLAEEKGIDTIRIGSEAKVQEAVIPYIFENKLITLRKRISESTTHVVSQTSQSIVSWSSYLALLKKHKEKIHAFEEAKKESSRYVSRFITPFRKHLHDLILENSNILGLINQKKERNDKLVSYRMKYDCLNKVLKVLLYLPMIYVWKNIEKYNNSVPELVEKQNAIATAYNENILKLKNNYKYFDENILKSYYSKYSDVIDSVNGVKNIPKSECCDINLYAIRGLDEKELLDTEKVQSYINYVNEEHTRAISVKETISEWEEEIGKSQNYALHQIVLDSVDLVGATCIGVNSQKRFQDLDFDVTIIDEAGQIQLHNALVPMSVSNKVIMLGDHMQIPPNADPELVTLCEENDVNSELLGKSLFEKMYYELPEANKKLLDTQYRMPAEIADVISGWFYDGEYKSPDFLRDTEPTIPSISNKNFVLVNTPSMRGKTYERKDPEGGYNNLKEADIISEIVAHILNTTDIQENQVGIISAYKSQVRLIKKELKGIVTAEKVDELVASLDSFQGQERDIILYSFTRSSKRKPTQSRIGFLSELRRLNVAMSRCKKLLIMVGDYEYLLHCKKSDAEHVIYAKDGKRVINGSEAVFSQFIETMCNSVKSGKGEMIDASTFVKRIKE